MGQLPRRLGLAGVHGVPLALQEGLVDGRRGRADQLVVVHVHEARGVRHQEEVRGARDPLYAGHPEQKSNNDNQGIHFNCKIPNRR